MIVDKNKVTTARVYADAVAITNERVLGLNFAEKHQTLLEYYIRYNGKDIKDVTSTQTLATAQALRNLGDILKLDPQKVEKAIEPLSKPIL